MSGVRFPLPVRCGAGIAQSGRAQVSKTPYSLDPNSDIVMMIDGIILIVMASIAAACFLWVLEAPTSDRALFRMALLGTLWMLLIRLIS
jgi:hypothetical protein